MQPVRFKIPILILITAALCLGLAQPATSATRAITYYVRQGFSGNCLAWATACDLQTALGMADDGDQVRVAAGTYYPTTTTDSGISFQMESGVAIYGGFPAAGGDWETRDWLTNTTILSANIGDPTLATDNSYHVVKNNNVTNKAILDGFVITGGYADYDNDYDWNGAGMLNVNSSPTLVQLSITGNEVINGFGGGMYNFESGPSLDQVSISGNHAHRGGGMYSQDSTITITNSIISNNEGHYEGGGMLSNNCTISLTNVTISNNDAFAEVGFGGGMANVFGTGATLSNVTFTGNTAGEYGGGMYNSESDPSLDHVTFSGNQAPSGGGMYNKYSTITITNSSFYNNDTDDEYGNGGGMVNANTVATLSNVTFSENTAANYGGGMYNSNSTINASFSAFTDNSAVRGGAVYNFEGTLSMTGTTLTGNHASAYGGGVYAQSNTPTLTDVDFINNTSDERGAGFMGFNSTSNLTRINFQGNTANGYGGGVYLESGTSTFTDVNFTANTSTSSSGGGLFNFGSSPALTNVTFSENHAVNGGGLSNRMGSNPLLRNVTFSANTANYGAAIHNDMSFPEIYSATLTLNVASVQGGGIYSTNTSGTTMINGIVWGNLPQTDQIFNAAGCSSDITYSDIEGGLSRIDTNINSNPMLMPLADNGGFTLTHALPFGSPAIDSGNPTEGFLSTDQRGLPRPFDGDTNGTAITDMGAYEYGFLVHLPLVFR